MEPTIIDLSGVTPWIETATMLLGFGAALASGPAFLWFARQANGEGRTIAAATMFGMGLVTLAASAWSIYVLAGTVEVVW